MYITENRVKAYNRILPDRFPYFSDMKVCAIDIETTGLSSGRDFIYLIGVLSEDGDGLKVTQFLAADRNDESQVLSTFFRFAEGFDVFLNYNGTSFDIPFINRRAAKHGLKKEIEACRSADLMRIFKASYIPSMLPDMKLKTVEKLAGIFREDTLSGGDCIAEYEKFSRTGNRSAGRSVLLHNYEDLSCFPALCRLMSKIDMHSAAVRTGFPAKDAAGTVFYITEIKKERFAFRISGSVPDCSHDTDYFGDSCILTVSSENKSFTLELSAASPVPDLKTSEGCREITHIITDIINGHI